MAEKEAALAEAEQKLAAERATIDDLEGQLMFQVRPGHPCLGPATPSSPLACAFASQCRHLLVDLRVEGLCRAWQCVFAELNRARVPVQAAEMDELQREAGEVARLRQDLAQAAAAKGAARAQLADTARHLAALQAQLDSGSSSAGGADDGAKDARIQELEAQLHLVGGLPFRAHAKHVSVHTNRLHLYLGICCRNYVSALHAKTIEALIYCNGGAGAGAGGAAAGAGGAGFDGDRPPYRGPG